MAHGLGDDFPPTPIPAPALSMIKQVRSKGVCYIRTDDLAADEVVVVHEAVHAVIGMSEALGIRVLQETSILFQPATIANAASAKGWLLFDPSRAQARF